MRSRLLCHMALIAVLFAVLCYGNEAVITIAILVAVLLIAAKILGK